PARGDKTFDFARGGIFPHVMTHSMHHRAQCLNMLRQIQGAPMTGVPEAGIPGAGGDVKLPPSSVLEWMLMGNG
ncbi:MAG: hypothetical protein O7G85_08935, partial [Planctomycetota bacterium]|nr:hypothetical protein [Planctomycetota bacterium]